jgi:uncharacterized protein YndB with AHSA1/START domain
MTVEPIQPYLEPVRKSVVVERTPGEAFEIFTARLAQWWPLERFSLGQADARSCVLEPRVGGEVYEVDARGARSSWGRVLVWEPPGRLVMSWHPGMPPEAAQEVEVRFTPKGSGTLVELEHRGWARLGGRAKDARDSYEGGWPAVLGEYFAGACRREEGQ